MAERNLTYAPTVAGETIDYKPLSFLAVAGLGTALVYAAVLLILGGASLVKAEPFFLSGWWYTLPIGGAVLSALGLYEVGNSEGTRAGAMLAKWGLGICAVTGLGYCTYHTVTAMAVLQQANLFLVEKDESSGFFPRLQGSDSDVNSAFLLTLSDKVRDVRVDNAAQMARFDEPLEQSPKGMLTLFLESPLVRVLHTAPAATVKIEALAVRDWAFENGAYHVMRTYRIATDEAVYEVPMNIVSIEPDTEGDKRRWRVMNFTPLQLISRTDYGIKRQALRQVALDFLADAKTGWLEKISQRRDPVEIYLGTQRALDRKLIREVAAEVRKAAVLLKEQGLVTALAGGGLAALAETSEEQLLMRRLRGYRPLSQMAKYLEIANVRLRDAALKRKVEQLAPASLQSLRVGPDEYAPVENRGGEVLVTYQAQAVKSLGLDRDNAPMLMLVKIVVAAPENLDPTAAGASDQCYVKSVELYRALVVPQPKQPGG